MTGFHQNYIGAQQHREYDKQALPHGIRPIPHLLKEAGYFTALMSRKVDCNFLPDRRKQLFEGTDWRQRKPGQPFFARITFGGTHRPWKRDPIDPIDASEVELPPYYADTPFIRRDWANGLEQMQLVDREVGALLKRLDDEGLRDNTLVFFIGDHGRCHIRGKQFLYDGGIRIPMIMRWPGEVDAGRVSEDLVSSLDLVATILEVSGAKSSVPVHGRSLFDPDLNRRQYVFSARDRMGDTHDAMRAIRSKQYKLILNLMPERPWCQFSGYKETSYPPLAEMNVLNLTGQLTPAQASFFAASKPEVELFDLSKDPYETVNVADQPDYAEIKERLSAELARWRRDIIHDEGVTEDFRAVGIFPDRLDLPSVQQWCAENGDNYDFRTHGLPPWYPTRTFGEWQRVREQWKAWVFRDPTSKRSRPKIAP